MKRAVVIAFAIGCSSSQKPVQPAPVLQKAEASCADVGSHLTATLPRWGASADEATKIAAVHAARCSEDRWLSDARECFATMTADTDAIKCDKVLAPDQSASLTKALEPIKQDALIADLEGFANQACNCGAGDVACANKLSEDMSTWAETHGATAPPIQPGDTRAEVIGKRLSECITKAMTPVAPEKPAGK